MRACRHRWARVLEDVANDVAARNVIGPMVNVVIKASYPATIAQCAPAVASQAPPCAEAQATVGLMTGTPGVAAMLLTRTEAASRERRPVAGTVSTSHCSTAARQVRGRHAAALSTVGSLARSRTDSHGHEPAFEPAGRVPGQDWVRSVKFLG